MVGSTAKSQTEQLHGWIHHINTGTLSILYFIARSFIPKFDELCLLVETNQPEFVYIVETYTMGFTTWLQVIQAWS